MRRFIRTERGAANVRKAVSRLAAGASPSLMVRSQTFGPQGALPLVPGPDG